MPTIWSLFKESIVKYTCVFPTKPRPANSPRFTLSLYVEDAGLLVTHPDDRKRILQHLMEAYKRYGFQGCGWGLIKCKKSNKIRQYLPQIKSSQLGGVHLLLPTSLSSFLERDAGRRVLRLIFNRALTMRKDRHGSMSRSINSFGFQISLRRRYYSTPISQIKKPDRG